MIQTAHGELPTPVFLPVGTAGAMRGITHDDLLSLGADILLCNTYHLHLQPGEEIVADAGGLHAFLSWPKPILTDSGGYQVFSLRHVREITDRGVHFQSHLSGDPLFLGPEEATRIQHALGADIIMCFDECPPSLAKRAEIATAVDRTLRWATECKRMHEELKRVRHTDANASSPLLFGIVQGGLERDLREKCAAELQAIGFDGYAVGGLAVGETEEEMFAVLDGVMPLLPRSAPRYLMGVGRRAQLRHAVELGIDMFDSVLPMREARHGALHLSDGKTLRITRREYATDHSPIDPASPSVFSRRHTKSYLHHLFRAGERLAETIACMQNMAVTLECIRELRRGIDLSSSD
jgi:queuine tRNA-ribosyltransferase